MTECKEYAKGSTEDNCMQQDMNATPSSRWVTAEEKLAEGTGREEPATSFSAT